MTEYFFSVVIQSLKDNSSWNRLLSNVENEVSKLIIKKETSKAKPQQPEIIELINKLIFEYMDWMGYKFTKSVFTKGFYFIINCLLIIIKYFIIILIIEYLCNYFSKNQEQKLR